MSIPLPTHGPGITWWSTPEQRADQAAPYFERLIRMAEAPAGLESTLTRMRRHVKKHPDQRTQLRHRLAPAIRETRARLKENQ